MDDSSTASKGQFVAARGERGGWSKTVEHSLAVRVDTLTLRTVSVLYASWVLGF